MAVEREVKLRFESADDARARVRSLGATLIHERRLQQDSLFDTHQHTLERQRSALRIRREAASGVITFKGPVQPGTMKVREELETTLGDPGIADRILAALGYRVVFRYEKFREEFAVPDAVIAIDETPVGVFVEIEGAERRIEEVAQALGRSPADYVTLSYRTLFFEHRERTGGSGTDMLFAPEA